MKRHAIKNRLYRIIWSQIQNVFIVYSEITQGQKKIRQNFTRPDIREYSLNNYANHPFQAISHCLRNSIAKTLGLTLLGFTAVQAAPGVNELPSGGQITQGSGTISQNGNTLTVQQTSDKLVGQWNSFNIGAQASVNFQQPGASSIALNRINDQKPSEILGRLNANGQVYLLNPNGIIFGKTAQVDVGGLVASTQQLSDQDFQSSQGHFTANSGSNTGHIDNQGQINGHGSVVAFIAPQVINSGTIKNDGGTVAMVAGEQVTLDFAGDGLVNVKVDKAALNALVVNHGLVQADAGTVIMTAQSASAVMDNVVNNDGLIQAKSLNNQAGRIILDGGEQGQTRNAGSLDVSSAESKGGQILVTGNKIHLDDGAHLNANGKTGGGEVLVGGDLHGSGPLRQATQVEMKAAATIDANATETGNGGKVVLWSDVHDPKSQTIVNGSINARGGAKSGNGGFIETSGNRVKIGDSSKVDTRVSFGKTGMWLLDPTDYTIAASGGDETGTHVSASLSSDRQIQVIGGNINVNDAISWFAHTLMLTSTGDININAVMKANSTASLDLQPGSTNVNIGFNPDGTFKGRVDFSSTGQLTIGATTNNTPNSYTVINSEAQLQNIALNLDGFFALGENFNILNNFTPIGTSNNQFTGLFNGLGHIISGLHINNTNQGIGLFGFADGAGIRNVGLLAPFISGGSDVGALLGNGSGVDIANSFVIGGSIVGTGNNIGGLVGNLNNVSSLDASQAKISVSGSNQVGGLVGYSDNSTVSNSHANGSVNGSNYVGGLIGVASGQSGVEQSYATGNVVAIGNDVGGLLGALIGDNLLGGIEAGTMILINSGFASGNVSGFKNVGGLVGRVEAGTGSASDTTSDGSIGISAEITDSYAIGAVSGNLSVGGLMGSLIGGQGGNGSTKSGGKGGDATITNSFSSGRVMGSSEVGGLIGSLIEGASGSSGSAGTGGLANITNSFYDKTSNALLNGVGNATTNIQGSVWGMTTADMKSQANFVSNTAHNGNSNPGWDFSPDGTWINYEGLTTPLLRSFMTPMTVTANSTTQNFNGLGYSGSAGVSYSIPPDNDHLFGDLSYTGGTNPGIYTISPSGLYSDQLGYILSFADGTLTITPGIDVVSTSVVSAQTGILNSNNNGNPNAANPIGSGNILLAHTNNLIEIDEQSNQSVPVHRRR